MATTDKPDDVEVRLADQEKINEFGRLNNRLLDIRAEVKQAKADHEKLKVISSQQYFYYHDYYYLCYQDASSELELVIDGKIMLLIGEAYVETDEEYAQECICNNTYLILFITNAITTYQIVKRNENNYRIR